MNIHVIQHVEFETPGSITTWCQQAGCEISTTRLFDDEDFPALTTFDLLIILGGPMSVNDIRKYPWLKREKAFIRSAIDSDQSVLGICLGAQLLASVLGAEVYPNRLKEIGWFPVRPRADKCPSVFSSVLTEQTEVFHWHGDTFDLPPGAIHLAESDACQNQGFVYRNKIIGLQFHLETTPLTTADLIENCRDELINAPFISSPEYMLSDPERFERINSMMTVLLNNIAGKF